MFGAVWAQAELRKVLGAMGGRVIEAELPVAHAARAARRRPPGAGARSSPSGSRRSSPSWSPRPSEAEDSPRPEVAARSSIHECRLVHLWVDNSSFVGQARGRAKKAIAAKWAAAAAMTSSVEDLVVAEDAGLGLGRWVA